MEKDQELKNLFKAFEDQAPELISIESVDKAILQKNQVKPFKTRKIMQTTTIVTIGLALSFYLFKPKTPSTSNKPSAAIESHSSNEKIYSPLEENNNLAVDINKSELSSVQSTVDVNFESRKTMDYALSNLDNSNVIAQIELDTLPSTIQIKDSSKILANETSNTLKKSTYNFIKLNEEELYKLGIVCRDGGVFYEETFNTKKPFKYSLIKINNTVLSSFEGGNLNALNNKDKYPTLITDLNVTSACGILNRNSLSDTTEIQKNFSYYIPVAVSLNKLNIDSPGVDAQIFWFPKSQYILDLLPAWAQETIKNDPFAFSWDMKENRKYGTQTKLKNDKPIENILLIKDKNYIVLNDNQLKDFGFKKDSLNRLELKIKARNFRYFSYFKADCHYVDLVGNSERAYRRAQKKYAHPIPIYISDSVLNPILNDITSLRKMETENSESVSQLFLLDKPNLIPIRIQHNKYDVDFLWYEANSSLFQALTEEQKSIAKSILKDSQTTSQNGNINVNVNSTKPIVTLEDLYGVYKIKTSAINPLILSKEILNKMGFTESQNNLEISIWDTLNKGIKITLYKHGTTIDQIELDTNKIKSLLTPDYISNDLGKYTYVSFKTNAEKDASKIDFNQLIPVLFETKRSYNTIDLYNHAARPNYLLWFKPTPEFLKLLPASEQAQIKSEMDSTHNGPCVYTDACKENKVNISKAVAYPNPNKGLITLKVELLKPIDYSYSIADLSGKMLIQKQVNFQNENNEVDIDLNDLENGIYYLYVYSNSGDLIVQKIVVMK